MAAISARPIAASPTVTIGLSRIGFTPEIEKVEPVVGRQAAIVLQPGGILLDVALQGIGACLAWQDHAVHQGLAVQLVAVGRKEQPEGEIDRTLQGSGEDEGPGGEAGLLAEE